jgi:hypothetical protein
MSRNAWEKLSISEIVFGCIRYSPQVVTPPIARFEFFVNAAHAAMTEIGAQTVSKCYGNKKITRRTSSNNFLHFHRPSVLVIGQAAHPVRHTGVGTALTTRHLR